MDKIEMEMNEDGSISTNSLYTLNQQAYDTVSPLNKVELHKQLKTREDKKYNTGIVKDLRECLENRGRVLDIRYIQDQDAWEIWVRIFENDSHQNYMYMFFNAEGFVVEV